MASSFIGGIILSTWLMLLCGESFLIHHEKPDVDGYEVQESPSTSDIRPVDPIEMNALKDLYYATDGPNWNYPSVSFVNFSSVPIDERVPWNFSNPDANPCIEGWTGIRCAQPTGHDPYHISHLDMLHFNMSGRLPPSVGNFAAIDDISFLGNALTGTIPAELGNLTTIRGLYLDINEFTGTLPEELGNLRALVGFGCSVNYLTGPIPESFGNFLSLRRLDIDKNMLSQSIPESLGSLTLLELLYLFDNKFTGTLPEALGRMEVLQGMYLSNNSFTGTLPEALRVMSDLKYLYVHHNLLTGTIPASYSGMTSLQTLALNDNFLRGSIPTSLSNISSLLVLQLQSNYLSGSLQGVINAVTQPNLNSIQVSDNLLTGQVPDNLPDFKLLHSFTAVSNCLQGSLPASLCQAGSLYSLIIDGLGSARGCNSKLLPGVSNAYESLNIVKGGLPACLFQMQNLTTLHLSGNGFTGPLPADVELGPYLVDLALSHNRLTGTIPLNIQQRRWYQLDLSYNMLSGTLNADFATVKVNGTHFEETHPIIAGLNASTLKEILGGIDTYTDISLSPLVYLENNRLSGRLPGYLSQLPDVSVLGSNLFQCNVWRTNLPTHDSGKNHYQCGSDSFNNPFYIWIILTAVSVLVLAFLYKIKWESSRRVQFSLSALWKAMRSTLPGEKPAYTLHVGVVFRVYDFLCQLAVVAVGFMVLVLLPCYVCFSVYYGTMTHQYAWVASAAYIRGTVPFGVEFVLLTGLLAMVISAFAHQYGVRIEHVVPISPQRWSNRLLRRSTNSHGSGSLSLEENHRDTNNTTITTNTNGTGGSGSANGSSPRGSGKHRPLSLSVDKEALKAQLSGAKLFAIYAIFLAVNLTVVVGVNLSFVLIAIYRSNSDLVVAQILLSMFKIWWNSVCARWIIRYTAKVITRTSDNAAAQHVDFVSLQLFVALFNNIVIPCLVVMVVSPSCFYNVLHAAPSVVSKEAVVSCFALSPLGKCKLSVPQVTITSYNPPFDYSYQCSSSLITYYAPAFVSLAMVSTFLTPGMQYVLAMLHRRAVPQSRWRSVVGYFLPHILKVHALDEGAFLQKLPRRVLFDPNSLLIQMITYIGVLLTFGAVFPPLAVALVVAMVVVCIVAKMSISLFLQNCLDRRLTDIVYHINSECKGVASNTVLYNALWMLISMSCIFYTIFLFDTLGDAVGWYGAYWLFFVMPLMPLVLFALFHVYSYFRPDASQEDKNGRNSGVELSLAGRGDTLASLDGADLEHGGPRSTSTFSPLYANHSPTHSQSLSLSLPVNVSGRTARALPLTPTAADARAPPSSTPSSLSSTRPSHARNTQDKVENQSECEKTGPECTPEVERGVEPPVAEVVVVENILLQKPQHA